MKRVAFLALAALVPGAVNAASLFGIAPGISGYNVVRINETTGAATIIAPIGLDTAVAINSMTYYDYYKKYLIVAQYGPNTSSLIWLDPNGWVLTSEPIDMFGGYFEAVENWPEANRLLITYGSNYYTSTIVHYNVLNQITMVANPGIALFDMDTMFLDGQGNMMHLDTNNPVDSSPLHRLTNFWTMTPGITPIGDWSMYNTTDFDGALHRGNSKVYLTRGTNLAVYDSTFTSITNLPAYGGGMNVTALAYGPEPYQVYGTVVLDDALGTFANGLSRTVQWAVKQGTVTVASGSTVTTNAVVNFSALIPDTSIQGFAIWEWDAGSHVKEKLITILPGTSFGFGTVTLNNGDADHSGEVDASDIDEVIVCFGNTYPGPGNVDADVDVSGEVDATDIDIVIANFGNTDD